LTATDLGNLRMLVDLTEVMLVRKDRSTTNVEVPR